MCIRDSPDARLRVKGPDPVEHLGALLGRGVAFALARDGVDEYRAPHLQGASERLLHKAHVMAVYSCLLYTSRCV